MRETNQNVDMIDKLFFRQVKNLTLRGKERNFMDWPNYKRRLDFLDDFSFQQDTRRHNVMNIS